MQYLAPYSKGLPNDGQHEVWAKYWLSTLRRQGMDSQDWRQTLLMSTSGPMKSLDNTKFEIFQYADHYITRTTN